VDVITEETWFTGSKTPRDGTGLDHLKLQTEEAAFQSQSHEPWVQQTEEGRRQGSEFGGNYRSLQEKKRKSKNVLSLM